MGIEAVVFAIGTGVLAPIVVTLEVPISRGREPVAVEVEARVTAGHRSDVPPVVKRLSVQPGRPTRVEIPLGEGVWRLDARAPEHWSPPAVVQVTGPGQTVDLRLWRTVPLFLALQAEPAGEVPAALHVSFRGSPEAPASGRVPQGAQTCPVRGGKVACEVPLGRLDLRLEAKGFVPVYLWSRDLSSTSRNSLGSIRLRPGASLSGYVRTQANEVARDTTVEALTPSGRRIESRSSENTRRSSPADRDQAGFPLQARTNERGFFQIDGIEPGEYQVMARRDPLLGLASAPVKAGTETRLPDFLVIEPPLDLDVTVEPATPPEGTAWTLKVVRLEPFTARLHERPVPESGSLKVGPIGLGRYTLEVWNGGERWFNRTLDVEEAPGPVAIRLPIVKVQGQLQLGGEPLGGVVIFGGRNGPLQIAMEADSEGRFQGSLPRAGDWVVSVEAFNPQVTRTLRNVPVEPQGAGEASVSINLPDTVVLGRVVDEKGMGHGMLVAVIPLGAEDRQFQIQAGGDGRFTLRGLAEGTISMEAGPENGLRSSVATVQVTDDRTQEVTLVVRGERKVTGRVQSAADETPIAGATILAFPKGPSAAGSRYNQTDPLGRFELSLPPGTSELRLVYWADGHAVHLLRLPIPAEPLILRADRLGGSLVVDFGREIDLGKEVETLPVVVHAGMKDSVLQFFVIALRRRLITSLPPTLAMQSIVLPQMAAGEYAVCLQSLADILADRPVQGPCERGTLLPGGELHLKAPSQGSTASGPPAPR